MIEKNIRLQPHHARDLLVGRRSDGRRPGYQPPGGGATSLGSGRDVGGGGGGGGGGGHHVDTSAARAAQAATDALNARRAAEAIARENEAREVAREKAIQVAALTTKTPTRSPHKDTQEQIIEQKILDDYGYQDKKAQAPKTFAPPIKTYERGVPFTDELVKTVTPPKYSPTYYQDKSKIGGETWGERAEAGIKRGMGLGTLAKGVGAALAWPVASAFVPPKLMTGLTWAKRAKDIKEGKGVLGWGAKKLGLDKKLSLASTQHLKRRPSDMPEHLGETGFRTRDDTPPRDGDGPKTLAETVTQGAGLADGQKMLGLDDKQIQQIYQGRDLLSTTIEAGVYQGQQLTAEQIKILQNKQMELNKLIEAIEKAQAPVNVAYGGRIDKALGGRSRDIG